jgi:hypothetical protein
MSKQRLWFHRWMQLAIAPVRSMLAPVAFSADSIEARRRRPA